MAFSENSGKPYVKNIPVPYIDQTLRWPTGCESVSAVMLLQYLGLAVSVEEFVRFLPKFSPFHQDGKMIGADPGKHFIGSPDDPDSFGCYAPVIRDTLCRIFSDRGLPLQALDLTGVSTEELLKNYIDRDLPVIYWATIDLKESYLGPSWSLYTPDGALFTWRSNEHCMLLTGYDEDSLYFNDPWHGHGCIAYDRQLVLTRHHEMYDMAVALKTV